jgi:hypothetical protein
VSEKEDETAGGKPRINSDAWLSRMTWMTLPTETLALRVFRNRMSPDVSF